MLVCVKLMSLLVRAELGHGLSNLPRSPGFELVRNLILYFLNISKYWRILWGGMKLL